MLRKFGPIGGLVMMMIAAQTFGARAQLAGSDDWPNSAFVKPLPSKVSGGDKAVMQDKDTSVKSLLEFMNSGAFLSQADVTNFSKSIESLVGNYFYFDEDKGVIQLLGSNFVEENKNVGIKDVVVFSAVVDRKFNAGAEVPAFLQLKMQKDDLAELTIRNIATVIGKSKSTQVACNAPFGNYGKDNEKLYYITAATVSMVYKKIFQVREQGGSGLISVLKLNGKNYYSSKVEQRVPVISVSSIPVPLVPKEKIHLCVKYNDALKGLQIAALGGGKKKVRALRSVKPSQQQMQQNELKKLTGQLSKVIGRGQKKVGKPVSGKVLRVKK